MLAFALVLGVNPSAHGSAAGYSVFLVPADEDNLSAVLDELYNWGDERTHAIISVTAWADDTVIFYDHWEDGYEFDPENPSTSTYDETYTLAEGQEQQFESVLIPLDRDVGDDPECDDGSCPYDGRDIVYVSGGSATMTRAGWIQEATTYQAVGWEVYPVRPQLVKYILPFGEELNGSGLNDFERVFAFVQATSDSTTIQVDINADGTYDDLDWDKDGTVDSDTYTLNKGEVFLLDRVSLGDQAIDYPGSIPDASSGNGTGDNLVITGTTIFGSDTIQVQYVIGDEGSTYEVRGLSAFPRGFWDNEYYAPVDQADNGARVTDVFLYNPHTSALTLSWETASGSGSFSIPASSTASFLAQSGASIPTSSAVYLSASDVFWGISTIDSEAQISDWAYSLVPANLLDLEHYMGWAPAYDFDQVTPPYSEPSTQDQRSGLFVTPAQDFTTIYVDEDNDGSPDQTYTADRMESIYVFSSDTPSALNDDDLSGARVYATGPFAMSFGQNPDFSASGDSPALDLGYTVLPTADKWFDLVLDVIKTVDPPVMEANASGEEAVFTLEVFTLKYDVSGVTVTDTLPAGWEYVAGSTTVTLPDLTTVTGSTADDGNSTGDTVLTWSGSDVFDAYADLDSNQTILIEFTARTTVTTFDTGEVAVNNVEVVGNRTVQTVTQIFRASDFTIVGFSDSEIAITKSSDVNSVAFPGDTIVYTVVVSNPGTTPLTNVLLFDPLPPGVTYVSSSAQVTSPNLVTENVRDTFATDVFNRNDGSVDWAGVWVESDSPQDPTDDDVRVTGGELRLRRTAWVYRQVDLSTALSAVLTFDYDTSGNVDNDEWTFVEVADSSSPSVWIEVLRFEDDDSGSVSYDIPINLFSTTTTVRFSTESGGNNEYRYFDDVDITFTEASGTVTSSTNDPPNFIGADDGYALPAGQALTLTFSATVDDPFPADQTEIHNTAYTQAAQIPVRISDDVIDPVTVPSSNGATVGDRVWHDANADGIYNPGEAGLAGIEVTLQDDFGSSIAVTITDSQGRYLFNDVPAGNGYYVSVTDGLPSGLTQTTDGRTDNRTASFDLSPSEVYLDADIGYESSSPVIGDLVWSDADGDGVPDPGEPGLSGIIVELYLDDGDRILDPLVDTLIDTTTTGLTGNYLFSGMAAGGGQDYFVYVPLASNPSLAGYTNTTTHPVFFEDVVNSDVLLVADFGYIDDTGLPSTYSIADRVWFDNGAGGGTADNGLQDGSEQGIAGVTVALLDSGGNTIASMTTDSDGNFQWTGVPGGQNYSWVITDENHILTDYFGTTAAALAGRFQMTGPLTADVDYQSSPNFGYDVTRTIGDTVYNDNGVGTGGVAGDGTQNGAEPGMAGVIVDLYRDVDGDGVFEPGSDDGSSVATLITDTNGSYLFSGLASGTYFVHIDDTQAGVTDYNLTTVDDEGAAGHQMQATISGGSSYLDADFGYRAPVEVSVNGFVWENNNPADANFDAGEDGLAGITVDLLEGGTVIRQKITDANGEYSFDGLPEGTYTIRVTDRDGVLSGYHPNYEETEGYDSDPLVFDAEESVTLSDGVTQDPVNFGFRRPPTPLPVGLSAFKASGDAYQMDFTWTTSTEVGNLGFVLYALVDGDWVALNNRLIPTRVIDSTFQQTYHHEVSGVDAQQFMIADVDVTGHYRYHGPFPLGHSRVSEAERLDLVPWTEIRNEHRIKEDRRQGDLRSSGEAAVRLELTEAGIYRVTFEELLTAGFDLSGPADELAICDRHGPIPIRVDGDWNFGPGSAIVFVGEALDSLHTDRNVYTLVRDRSRALRMELDQRGPQNYLDATDHYRHTLRIEKDELYSTAAPTGDPWYDEWMLANGGSITFSTTIAVDNFLPSLGDLSLTVDLWGVTDWPQSPDHHVLVRLNGSTVADDVFDGLVVKRMTAQVDGYQVVDGDNLLELTLPLDLGLAYDAVALEAYSVSYPRRLVAPQGQITFTGGETQYRVDSLPAADVRVFRVRGDDVAEMTGVLVDGVPGRFSATFGGAFSLGFSRNSVFMVTSSSRMLKPEISAASPAIDLAGQWADYLIISHPDFVDGLQPLIEARRDDGFKVAVADVEQIYSRHSGGVIDPAAISEFIAFAHKEMGARMVLLVGGDTYDYNDVLGLGSVSFIPSLYVRTGDFVAFAPADPLYGDLDGDGVPELPVGRFPVRSSAELETIINKTLQYGDIDYRNSALSVTDSYDAFEQISFAGIAAEMLGEVPPYWRIEHADLEKIGFDAARARVFDNINRGVAFVQYLGHSAPTMWSFERLLTAADTESFTNSGRPAVIAQWGCWNTYHVQPEYNTMGHKLLLSGDRGAAAVLGATTLTDTISDLELGSRFVPRLLGHETTIGEALVAAKKELAREHPEMADVIAGWTLLGDPALVVAQ